MPRSSVVEHRHRPVAEPFQLVVELGEVLAPSRLLVDRLAKRAHGPVQHHRERGLAQPHGVGRVLRVSPREVTEADRADSARSAARAPGAPPGRPRVQLGLGLEGIVVQLAGGALSALTVLALRLAVVLASSLAAMR